jgi:signal transduction histidine kinase
MSRYDAGVADIERIPFGVAAYIQRVLVRLGVTEVPLVIAPGADSAVVLADERRLERSLANVLDNARVYGGGPTLVTVRADDTRVEIIVDDDGPSVPPEERDLIFERFARGTTARRYRDREGSGLGLALARENMHAQGGRIYVGDAPGGGARFVIELERVDT